MQISANYLNFSASGRTINKLEGRQCIEAFVMMGGVEFCHTIAICLLCSGDSLEANQDIRMG